MTPIARTALQFAAALTVAVLFTACSADRHTINGGELRGRTVSIVDSATAETIWTRDIPAGKKMVVDFEAADGDDAVFNYTSEPASRMKWWVYPLHQKFILGETIYNSQLAEDHGTVDLPGTPIRMEVTQLDQLVAAPADANGQIQPIEPVMPRRQPTPAPAMDDDSAADAAAPADTMDAASDDMDGAMDDTDSDDDVNAILDALESDDASADDMGGSM